MTDAVCRACGSERVIPNAEVRDYDATSYRPLTLVAERADPQETKLLGIIPGTVAATSAQVRARVCGDCGHVEFFALDAHRMWSEYSGT